MIGWVVRLRPDLSSCCARSCACGAASSKGMQPAAREAAVGAVPLARDPVCGTFVVPSRGAEHGGTGADMRFFCSEKCRRTYEMKLAR